MIKYRKLTLFIIIILVLFTTALFIFLHSSNVIIGEIDSIKMVFNNGFFHHFNVLGECTLDVTNKDYFDDVINIDKYAKGKKGFNPFVGSPEWRLHIIYHMNNNRDIIHDYTGQVKIKGDLENMLYKLPGIDKTIENAPKKSVNSEN